jgi:ATP-binding cassette subfamily B protein/subfamily B ATP-binding cassette protein MsbA
MAERQTFWQITANYLGQSKRSLVLAVGAMVALTITDLMRPWPLKIILDHILLNRPWPPSFAFAADLVEEHKTLAILLVSAAIFVVAVLRGAFAFLESYHTSHLGNQIAFCLRTQLFSQLQRLSLNFHTHRQTGELMTKIVGDTTVVQNFVSDSALTLGSHLLAIVGTFAVMFLMNWKLALVVLASFPPLVATVYCLHHRAGVAARRQRKKEDRIASRINETLTSVRLIQAFGRANYEQARFDDENSQYLAESLRSVRIESAAARAVELTTALGTCAVVLYGSLQVLEGTMTPGTILVFSSYLHGLYRPIRRLVKLTIRLSQLRTSGQRIAEILELEHDIKDSPHAMPARNIRGEIAFDRVCFAYAASEGNVLQDITFRVLPGQRVAIVGASGAGKSTLVGLILRLHDPAQGVIQLDGVDLRDYQLDSLRNNVAIVLQDSVLRGATVYENIAYGNLQASRDDVIAAAHAAGAHEFISQLPDGYDTVVGERGARLSGGQQRRIAIARALVRDAPILILDEPMTGLDIESERQVRQALRTLMAGKTCLIITHDLHSVVDVDRVIVLEQGTIVDSGLPHEVFAFSGGEACYRNNRR